MTSLHIAPPDDPRAPSVRTSDPDEIATRLAAIGVEFEQWGVAPVLPPGATPEEVLAAYHDEVDRMMTAGGYVTVDVARLHPSLDDPTWPVRAAEARAKFLAEHCHDDDEVRFFVEGTGAFYLRGDEAVHVVVCEAGDLVSVPKGMRHWFDMGSNPSFAAIRFFREPDGWVGRFTGDPIAASFPSFDELVAPAT